MKHFALVLIAIFLTAGTALSQDGSLDTQFWNETQVTIPVIKKADDSGKVTEKLSFFINGNLRTNQNMGRFIDQRAGFGFVYKHSKYVSFTPSYIYIAQKPLSGLKVYESRLRFAVNLENRWKNFSLDDRNLIEYRFRNNAADNVRYRNRLKFVYPIRKNDKEILAPFASNEAFYDFQAKAISRNELSLGVTRKLNPNVSADFFYLWQVNRSSLLRHANVFGVNIKIKID